MLPKQVSKHRLAELWVPKYNLKTRTNQLITNH